MTFNEGAVSVGREEGAGILRTVLAHGRGDLVWWQAWRVIVHCLDLFKESL
jgi:hypothetical protein